MLRTKHACEDAAVLILVYCSTLQAEANYTNIQYDMMAYFHVDLLR